MSVSPEAQSGDLIADLGLIVGIEQGCSISAAEAHDAAHKIVAGGAERKVFLMGEDPTIGQSGKVVELRKRITVGNQVAALSIVQPYDESETRRPYRRLLRKVVDVSRVRTETDPLLCARVGEDAYLPLARFALESSSEYCSYVQLGSEMTDETVVMTALDERTSRQQVVEAIRTLFRESSPNDKAWSDIQDSSAKRIIQGLTDQQRAAHAEHLIESQEAMLVRRCVEKVNDKPATRKLNILAEGDNIFEQTMLIRTLLQNCKLDDSRFVDLALTKSDNNDIQAVAITRGNLAFLIASFIADTGKVVFESIPNSADPATRLRLVEILLDRVRNKPMFSLPAVKRTVKKEEDGSNSLRDKWAEFKQRARTRFGAVPITEAEYFFDASNYHHTIPATYLYRKGLLRKDEGAVDDPFSVGMTAWGVNRTFQELDELFEDPELFDGQELSHFLDCPPVWLALSRLPLQRQAEQRLFDTLGISARIRKQLGETTLDEERFVKQMQKLITRGNIYQGTVENVNTGTNNASLDIEVRLYQDGTSYRVKLFAKAHALKKQPFPTQPYKTLEFDTLTRIASNNGVSRNEALENIHRFSTTLQKICEPDTY